MLKCAIRIPEPEKQLLRDMLNTSVGCLPIQATIYVRGLDQADFSTGNQRIEFSGKRLAEVWFYFFKRTHWPGR